MDRPSAAGEPLLAEASYPEGGGAVRVAAADVVVVGAGLSGLVADALVGIRGRYGPRDPPPPRHRSGVIARSQREVIGWRARGT